MQKRQGTYLYPTKEQVDSFKSQISLSTHHHHLHTFENSFTGKQAMKIIRNIDKAFADYDQAMQFGNLMILAGVIEPLNFRHHRFFSPKSKFIYTKGQGEGFENLFWLYHDEEEGPASLSMEDYKEEVFDSELSEEERNNLKQIPSAGGIPIAGVALKLATPGDMNRSMQRLGRELCPKVGGIFKMTLMNNKFVVVSDPDIVETVFVSENFGKKTEHDTFFHELRVFRGEGLSSASDGCVHNQCAGVIAPQLVKKCFEKYVPTVLSVIHDSLQEVREKGSFEARPFFSKIMTRIIGFVTLGFDLYGGDPEWMKFVDGITFVADQSVNRAFKASKYVPNHAIKFKKTVEQMNNLLMNFVKDRREKLKKIPKPKEEYDMLDLLITTPIAENDGTKIYMSDELIRANLETIISAQNTTTSMLSWTLNFLYDWELGNSSYLYKLIQEVDNISQGDRDYQPTLDDVYKRMTFMTNVLWESLRLCPPIPTVIRHCIKTCNVGGYLVRRGTTVMVSALGTHLNPKSFDDPFTYNPDRWSKPNVKKKPCSFVVWAAGKRQCVGREFALLTGRMALFCLLNQFALEMSPKAKVVTNEHLFVFPDGLIMNAKPRPNVEPLEPKQKQQENEKKESREEDSVPDANWDGIVNLIQHEQYKMVILKGTNSSGGTVETVSDWFVKKSQKLGFDTEDSPIELNEFLHHVKDQKPDKFSIWGLVVASYNGKPAKNANLFYEWLQEKAESGEDKEYLKHIRYFVFGCGSTNWVATYRKIPNSFDDWMQALGATRIDVPAEFNEAEDELEDVFSDYYKNLLPKLMHKLPAIGEQKLQSVNKENGGENGGNPNSEDFSESLKLEAQKSSSAIQMEVIGTVDDVDVDFIHSACDLEESEFELCKIKKIFNITPNSDRATIGIELERNSLEYETGDHLVVYPIQRKEYAERVIQHFVDYDLETVVTFEKFQSANKSHFRLPVGKNISVENILLSIVDLKRKPNKAFMMNYSVIVDNEEHKEKLQSFANDRKLFKKWLHEHEPVSIVDVIEMFPPQKENFDRLLEILPILEPRKFSITSSPNVHKNEIHLCAAAERVEFENGVYEGICSQYWDSLLNENGTKVYCKVEKADESFRIPDDEKPMILISAGTGFAPMRGFLHERKFREAKGKNIVIFGCRTEENDLLYREELQEWKKSGFADIYFAFSRSEGCKKKYVQDVIKEQKDLLWELVDEKGAFVFVCGNGSTMAVGVRDAFLEFIQEHCPHDEKDHEQWANDYLSNLEKHNRYEIDVWG